MEEGKEEEEEGEGRQHVSQFYIVLPNLGKQAFPIRGKQIDNISTILWFLNRIYIFNKQIRHMKRLAGGGFAHQGSFLLEPPWYSLVIL